MTILHVKSHFKGLHLLTPFQESNSYHNPQSLKFPSKSRIFVSFASVSDRTLIENCVVCARRKRSRSSGHQRTVRLLLKSLSFFTRNLEILPQPLDFIIAELGGGDGGGGLGFRRGFGGWGGSDGWRKQGKRLSLSVFFWIILGFFGFCIISGKENKSDMIFPVLGFFFFGIALFKELKIKAKDLVFGFFCLGALLVVGLKKENFVKLTEEIRSCSSVFIRKKRNKSRRRL